MSAGAAPLTEGKPTMQKIDIFVPKRRVVWLPAVSEPDKALGRPRLIHPKMLLSAGANSIPSHYWDKISDMPQVRSLIENEQIVIGAPAKQRAAASPTTPDAVRGVSELKVSVALPFIEASSNATELAGWRNADRRVSVHNAIDKRVAYLLGESGDDPVLDDVDDLDDLEDEDTE